ncbi:MAG: hypothetical protein Ta2D_01890 [Rickettsiales bacterium]|nr:MAG: hypothetical protein Ta2D_01890 [Rickettsiales bacterium]
MEKIENWKREIDIEKTEKINKEEKKDNQDLSNNREKIDNSGKEQFYKLRTNWSWFLMGCVSFLIFSQVCLMILLGVNWFDLSLYNNIVMAFFIETFAQIIGMGIIVVAFLFKENK